MESFRGPLLALAAGLVALGALSAWLTGRRLHDPEDARAALDRGARGLVSPFALLAGAGFVIAMLPAAESRPLLVGAVVLAMAAATYQEYASNRRQATVTLWLDRLGIVVESDRPVAKTVARSLLGDWHPRDLPRVLLGDVLAWAAIALFRLSMVRKGEQAWIEFGLLFGVTVVASLFRTLWHLRSKWRHAVGLLREAERAHPDDRDELLGRATQAVGREWIRSMREGRDPEAFDDAEPRRPNSGSDEADAFSEAR